MKSAADPMHVLIVNVFFAPNTYGGATVVAEEVGRHLAADHGVRVSAVSAVCRPDLQPYATVRAEVDGIESWLINLPPGRGYVDAYLNAEVGERIARIVDDISPDLVHVHCVQDIGADCIARVKAAGIPVVLSVHDFWWLCERQFMLTPAGTWCGQSPIRIGHCRGCVENIDRARARQSTLIALANQADAVTFPSRYAFDLCTQSGLAPRTGLVWQNGIRPPGPGFFDAQAKRRERDRRLAFGFVGGPSRIKGWPIVHDAFDGLGREDFRCVVVEGSPSGDWWRGRSFDHLDGEWSVHPRYDQASMDAFFAGIDVLLFPSQWKETFGLTVREALARGIRVIQTDSGGTTEHPAYAPGSALAIGDGPNTLRTELHRVLDAPSAHPDPVAVTTQSEQAAAFLDIAESVTGKRVSPPRKAAGANPRKAA